jgi:hypothetical protein
MWLGQEIQEMLLASARSVSRSQRLPRKEEFLTSLGEGTFEDQAVPMAFEASIQDRWRTGSGEHVRAEIAAINVSWSD